MAVNVLRLCGMSDTELPLLHFVSEYDFDLLNSLHTEKQRKFESLYSSVSRLQVEVNLHVIVKMSYLHCYCLPLLCILL